MQTAQVSTEELASWLACSVGEIKRLAGSAGVLKRAAPGKFDLKDNVQAYARYQRERKAQGSHWGGGNGAYGNERTRLTAVKAKLAEQVLAQRSGEVIPAALVKQTWSAILAIIRTRLLAMPSTIAPRAVGKTAAEVGELVRAEVYDCLNYLAATEIEASAPTSTLKKQERNKAEVLN